MNETLFGCLLPDSDYTVAINRSDVTVPAVINTRNRICHVNHLPSVRLWC